MMVCVWQGLKSNPSLLGDRPSGAHDFVRAFEQDWTQHGRRIGRVRPRRADPCLPVRARCICGRLARQGRQTCSHGRCLERIKAARIARNFGAREAA
jgi:hypothetical protein